MKKQFRYLIKGDHDGTGLRRMHQDADKSVNHVKSRFAGLSASLRGGLAGGIAGGLAGRLKEIVPLLGAAGIDIIRSMPRDIRIQWLQLDSY